MCYRIHNSEVQSVVSSRYQTLVLVSLAAATHLFSISKSNIMHVLKLYLIVLQII